MSASPTPSAVPDDLREMARRTVDVALADPRMDEANGVEAAMQDAIAAALLQVRNAATAEEREASAKVADGYEKDLKEVAEAVKAAGDPKGSLHVSASAQIARGISREIRARA